MLTSRQHLFQEDILRHLIDSEGFADPLQVAGQIASLKRAGRKVHVIFDVDHVLVSGRSHDVFDMVLKRDVGPYREYEARQFLQLMDEGPYTDLARLVNAMHDSQDIVTARAGYSALRVMFFCLAKRLKFHDMLFVGGQSKATSYSEILKRFKGDRDWHVFMLDDSRKHVDDFERVARDMGMHQRCYPLLTRQERSYTEDELRLHFDDVMREAPDGKPFVAGDGTPESPRHFLVTPDAHCAMLRMLQDEVEEIKDDLLRTLIQPPSRPRKRGYDAIVEANRRANEELSSMHRAGPGFFDRHRNDSED